MQISGARPWLASLVQTQLSENCNTPPDTTGCHAQVLELSANCRHLVLFDGQYTMDAMLTVAAKQKLDEDPSGLGLSSASLHGRTVAPVDVVLVPDVNPSPPRATLILRDVRVFADSLAHRPERCPTSVLEDPAVLRTLRTYAARHLATFADPPPSMENLQPNTDEIEEEQFARDILDPSFPPASLRLEDVFVPGPAHASPPAGNPPKLRISQFQRMAVGREVGDDDQSTMSVDDEEQNSILQEHLTLISLPSQSSSATASRSPASVVKTQCPGQKSGMLVVGEAATAEKGSHAGINSRTANESLGSNAVRSKEITSVEPNTLESSEAVAEKAVPPVSDPDVAMTEHHNDESEKPGEEIAQGTLKDGSPPKATHNSADEPVVFLFANTSVSPDSFPESPAQTQAEHEAIPVKSAVTPSKSPVKSITSPIPTSDSANEMDTCSTQAPDTARMPELETGVKVTATTSPGNSKRVQGSGELESLSQDNRPKASAAKTTPAEKNVAQEETTEAGRTNKNSVVHQRVVESVSAEDLPQKPSAGNTVLQSESAEHGDVVDAGDIRDDLPLFMQSEMAKKIEQKISKSMFTFHWLEKRRKTQPWDILLADMSIVREARAAQMQEDAETIVAPGVEEEVDRDVAMDAAVTESQPVLSAGDQKRVAGLIPESAPF